ncbi:hypothetical protein GVO57_05985 [Sphingomonas changnyeongensis]|uniref:Beta/Gamma crystallin n=1 Tax=Sphingomonas changnyeongensis TaxID=2698679 RepID=A0A7Z2S7L7_9SPHN|nr:hypothetical protein [Sphingomonas changnyeongensis]QHL90466.1 hypothetical protein GVO57_05985 [Sphingomonas changnyeongensis]
MRKTNMMTAATALAALLAQPLAAAPAPGSVRDLIGARAAGGETELETRGFTLIHGSTDQDRKVNYWWNGNTRECVKIVTYDGRFEAVSQTTAADCNQKGNKGDTAAAVAIGAAALLGIAALASKSHQRGDRYDDERGTAEFERGYRDGLYNQSYHNYGRSDAYSHGYEQGVRERGSQTAYRPGGYYGGGYADYSGINDLEGRPRDLAISELNRRGFAMRDNKRTDEGRYITFWRASSRQCVILHSQGGSVVSVETVSPRTCSY